MTKASIVKDISAISPLTEEKLRPKRLSSIAYKKILSTLRKVGNVSYETIETLPLPHKFKQELKNLSCRPSFKMNLIDFFIAFETERIRRYDFHFNRIIEENMNGFEALKIRDFEEAINELLEQYRCDYDLEIALELGATPTPSQREQLNDIGLNKLSEIINDTSNHVNIDQYNHLLSLSNLNPDQYKKAAQLLNQAVRKKKFGIVKMIFSKGIDFNSESQDLIDAEFKKHLLKSTNYFSHYHSKFFKSLGAKVSQSDPELNELINKEVEKNITLEKGHSSPELIKTLYNLGGIKPSQEKLDRGFEGALEKYNLSLAKWYLSIGAVIPDSNKLNQLLISNMKNYFDMRERDWEDYLNFFYTIGATLTEKDFEQELYNETLKPNSSTRYIEILYKVIKSVGEFHGTASQSTDIILTSSGADYDQGALRYKENDQR